MGYHLRVGFVLSSSSLRPVLRGHSADLPLFRPPADGQQLHHHRRDPSHRRSTTHPSSRIALRVPLLLARPHPATTSRGRVGEPVQVQEVVYELWEGPLSTGRAELDGVRQGRGWQARAGRAWGGEMGGTVRGSVCVWEWSTFNLHGSLGCFWFFWILGLCSTRDTFLTLLYPPSLSRFPPFSSLPARPYASRSVLMHLPLCSKRSSGRSLSFCFRFLWTAAGWWS